MYSSVWRCCCRDVAQAAIIRAEGESEAAALISEALRANGSGMVEVKRIDVRSFGFCVRVCVWVEVGRLPVACVECVGVRCACPSKTR